MKSQCQHIIIIISLILSGFISLSAIAPDDNAPVQIIVSSPPDKYGDTIDLTTFNVDEKWHAGGLIENMSSKDLILERTVSSDPKLKCKVWMDTVVPGMKVSVWGIAKFDKPVGNFKIKTEIYWKNYKNPTVIYFKGNCVEKE